MNFRMIQVLNNYFQTINRQVEFERRVSLLIYTVGTLLSLQDAVLSFWYSLGFLKS